MAKRVEFLFVCDQSFARLPGDDPQRRRCGVCSRDVHNLDAMSAEAQDELLSRAAGESTTVCASATVPTGTPGCGGERTLVGRVVPVVPRQVPAAPAPWRPLTRDDPDCEWRELAEELPAVRAALDELAREFALVPSDRPGCWRFEYPEVHVTGQLEASARGDGVAVGLRIPLGPLLPPIRTNGWRGLGPLLGPIWIVVAGFLLAGFYSAWQVGVALTLLVLGIRLVVPLLGWFAERRAQRAARAWADPWRARLWAALEGRLAQRRLYRSPGG